MRPDFPQSELAALPRRDGAAAGHPLAATDGGEFEIPQHHEDDPVRVLLAEAKARCRCRRRPRRARRMTGVTNTRGRADMHRAMEVVFETVVAG